MAVGILLGGIVLAFTGRAISTELVTVGSTAVGFIGGLLAGQTRTSDLRERLRELSNLMNEGILEPDEYEEARRAVIFHDGSSP